VLVVEDYEDTRDALVTLLRICDYEVHGARDGAEALDVLRAGVRPCLILLDLTMPRMDGAEFRAAQLRDPALRNIPVALLTGLPRQHPKVQSLASLETVQKPIDAERLLRLVQEHCPQLAA